MTQRDGPHLFLSEAVTQASRAVGVLPVTATNSLQVELETPELQEAYTKQVVHRHLASAGSQTVSDYLVSLNPILLTEY